MKKVLLVDDEVSVLEMLETYLGADQDSYELLTTNTPAKALEILELENISLVISDIYMPEISGLDLLAIIRDRYPHIKVILITGYGTPKLRKEVEESSCLYFLEKPLRLRQLRSLISQEMDREEGFGGTLRNIQLHDLIQMCCLSMVTIAIKVQHGTEEGTIYIDDGELIHAACNQKEGEEAFYEIIGWSSGCFETMGSVFTPKVSLNKNCEALLLEGMRLADENRKHPADNRPELRVMIVDDSPIMRKILSDMLASDRGITIVGTAKDGEEALQQIELIRPDVVTLDVNMPVMDGKAALKHIMIRHPCPVVVIGAEEERSGEELLDFLRFGAADFVRKPIKAKDTDEQRRELIDRIRLAATAKVNNFKIAKAPKILSEKSYEREHPPHTLPGTLVIISSGSGGYPELLHILPRLSGGVDICFVVFQVMPRTFIGHVVRYLNTRTRLDVLPLKSESELTPGRCYISAGVSDFPARIVKDEDSGILRFSDADPKPEPFDLFLSSAADVFSGSLVVALFSGADVGKLEGLRKIREKGGRVITQSLDTCMVTEPLERVKQVGLIDTEINTYEIWR